MIVCLGLFSIVVFDNLTVSTEKGRVQKDIKKKQNKVGGKKSFSNKILQRLAQIHLCRVRLKEHKRQKRHYQPNEIRG